jgi:hypothetical protein
VWRLQRSPHAEEGSARMIAEDVDDVFQWMGLLVLAAKMQWLRERGAPPEMVERWALTKLRHAALLLEPTRPDDATRN